MKTDPSPLTLENARGTTAKISLNVLHKDANLTIFTIPVEGVELVEEQLDSFLGKYTFRSWYEKRKDGSWHPCGWWLHRKDADFPIDEEFHTDSLTLGLSGDQVLEFETQEPEEEDDDKVPAAKITSIRLKPTAGGVTLLSFHLQVRPGLGKDNLLLQEHQFRPVTVTLGETTLAPKKGKQQSLPLEPGKGNTTPLTGEHIAATSNGEAQESAPPADEGSEGAAETVTDSGTEAHPDPDATNGTADDPATDLARFEAGATQAAAEFKTLAENGVIDGRSERVRHQDRQRARGSRRVQ